MALLLWHVMKCNGNYILKGGLRIHSGAGCWGRARRKLLEKGRVLNAGESLGVVFYVTLGALLLLVPGKCAVYKKLALYALPSV
jgi:hypothetical protein